MKTFQDFRNEISIIELAIANGYKVDNKAGHKWPVLKNDIIGEKIVIRNPNDSSNQGYFNPHDDKDKGTLITFIQNRLGSIFPVADPSNVLRSVNVILYNFLRLPEPARRFIDTSYREILNEYKPQKFVVPRLLELTNSSYLTSRGINSNLLKNDIFEGWIYNLPLNNFVNVAFPYFDSDRQIIGCEVRNKGYKAVLPGSDRSNGIWHSRLSKDIKNVILTESPIDALSYHQIKGKEMSLYISFGGAVATGQLHTLASILDKIGVTNSVNIYSAVDNDEAGKKYTAKFTSFFNKVISEDYPVNNDYNQDLDMINRRGGSFKR